MVPALAPFIVCPETLGPLERRDDGYWSPKAERLYPYAEGLAFLGYPTSEREMILSTMAEERGHQGVGVAIAAQNLDYLRQVAPGAVELINTLQRFVPDDRRPLRSLELGSGNGWVSWLMAEAGFEVWMGDFEANSLATGLHLEHANIGEGKRFVMDARYAPVATGSMDVVLLKEFVHHVADHKSLFREAARALRPGGIVVFQEVIRSMWSTMRELRHPDPHEGHHVTWPQAYVRSMKSAGLELVYDAPVYRPDGNTRFPASWLKAQAIAAINEERPGGNWLTKLQLLTFGGAQVRMIARKTHELPLAERPPMTVIDPATLVVDEDTLAGYAEFPTVLRDVASRLERVPAA